jgi:predicted acylesterase/phospholipase RssA
MTNDDRDVRRQPRSSGRELTDRSRRPAASTAASTRVRRAGDDLVSANNPVSLDDDHSTIDRGDGSSAHGAIPRDPSTVDTSPHDSSSADGAIPRDPSTVDTDPHVFDQSFRILTIDGGGARGMIPAVILEEVERRADRRISSMFHRICGTSTGSILACGLAAPEEPGSTTPRFRASEIVEIYRTLGAEIFSRGSFNDTVIEPMGELLALADHTLDWFVFHAGEVAGAVGTAEDVWQRINAPLHDVNKLAYVLHEYLGDLRLNEALTELFVYAYDIGSRTPQVLGSVASSIGAFAFPRVRMYQAATASSAAVPFFGPYRLWRQADDPVKLEPPPGGLPDVYLPPTGSGDDFDLVDGGNGGLGNPTLFAVYEETDLSAGHDRFVLSLGTGNSSNVPITTEARGWGFLQWLGEGGELLKCIFDGESDVTNMVMEKLEESGGVTYFRWQPHLPESLAFLDEGSVEDMNLLEDVARTFIADNDEEIDQVVELLTAFSVLV